MKDLGIYIVKISTFLFIAAGAGLASIGMPLADYAKEARTLQFQVEEKIGKELSEENCAPAIAFVHRADCRSALYMQQVTDSLTSLLNFWVNIFLTFGVMFFLTGSIIYIKEVLAEKRQPKLND